MLARLLLNSAAGHNLVQPASIAWRNVAEQHPRVRNNLEQAINGSQESERVYFHEGGIWWARLGVAVLLHSPRLRGATQKAIHTVSIHPDRRTSSEAAKVRNVALFLLSPRRLDECFQLLYKRSTSDLVHRVALAF